MAFDLIEASGLGKVTEIEHIDENVDQWLIGFMEKIVNKRRTGVTDFSFGRAQKLVNIYLKTVLVCGGHHQNPRVALLHPHWTRTI